MPHPFLHHVQGNAVDRCVDPEAVAQTFGAAVRRVRDPGFNHDALDDLPDPHAADRPDRGHGPLAGGLRLADAVGGVQGIEKLGWDRHGPEYDFLLPCGVAPLLEGPDRNGAAGEVDPGRCDLQQLGGPAPGPVQRLAQGAVTRGLASGNRKEGGPLLGVQIEAVSGGVMEAHFGHSE